MSKHNYKAGEIVEVFDDPITKKISQGMAKIVFVILNVDHYYRVIFSTDGTGERYSRFIY